MWRLRDQHLLTISAFLSSCKHQSHIQGRTSGRGWAALALSSLWSGKQRLLSPNTLPRVDLIVQNCSQGAHSLEGLRSKSFSWGWAHSLLPPTQPDCAARKGRETGDWGDSWQSVPWACLTFLACRMHLHALSPHPTLSPHTSDYDGVDACTACSYKFFISFV